MTSFRSSSSSNFRSGSSTQYGTTAKYYSSSSRSSYHYGHSHYAGLSVGLYVPGVSVSLSWGWSTPHYYGGYYYSSRNCYSYSPYRYSCTPAWGWVTCPPRYRTYYYGYSSGCSSRYYDSCYDTCYTPSSWSVSWCDGWWGFSWGSCYNYYPVHCYTTRRAYNYGGSICRVHRPYWCGYRTWYDYRPGSYGYSRYVYTSLDDRYEEGYDEGFDTGYDRGYGRGYEDGAEDGSEGNAFHDERQRESIGPSAAQRAKDKNRSDSSSEFGRQLDQGDAAFASGDYDAATGAYKEAVILRPTDVSAKVLLGRAALASGKYGFAAFSFRRVLTAEPERAQNLGDLRDVWGDPALFDEHFVALKEEAKAQPEDADLHFLLGYVQLSTGDAASAAASLETALAQNPEDEAAKALYAEALRRMESGE